MVIISSYYDSLYSIDAAVNECSNLCSKMDIMIKRGLHGVYCLVYHISHWIEFMFTRIAPLAASLKFRQG